MGTFVGHVRYHSHTNIQTIIYIKYKYVFCYFCFRKNEIFLIMLISLLRLTRICCFGGKEVIPSFYHINNFLPYSGNPLLRGLVERDRRQGCHDGYPYQTAGGRQAQPRLRRCRLPLSRTVGHFFKRSLMLWNIVMIRTFNVLTAS